MSGNLSASYLISLAFVLHFLEALLELVAQADELRNSGERLTIFLGHLKGQIDHHFLAIGSLTKSSMAIAFCSRSLISCCLAAICLRRLSISLATTTHSAARAGLRLGSNSSSFGVSFGVWACAAEATGKNQG